MLYIYCIILLILIKMESLVKIQTFIFEIGYSIYVEKVTIMCRTGTRGTG